jgi:hypothetical protein
MYTEMAYPGLQIEGHPCHSLEGHLKKCALPLGRLVWTLAFECEGYQQKLPFITFLYEPQL